MAPRTATLLMIGLLALSGVSVGGGAVIDAPPTLTVENERNTTHEVTAYTVVENNAPMQTNFRVTTDDGDRRLATLEQLYWSHEFRNVTLADEGIPSHRLTVESGENVTATIDGWEPGDVTIYVVEDLGADERHVLTRIISCTEREQDHDITLREGGAGGGSVCASSFDWLLQ